MTYDTWKSTEPDYGDERPEECEARYVIEPDVPDLIEQGWRVVSFYAVRGAFDVYLMDRRWSNGSP